MAASEILYTFRDRAPMVLERGRAQVTKLEAYRDGALVAPTEAGSTYSLLSPLGTAIVDAQAVTVSGSVAQYALSASELASTLDLEQGYTERWVLVMPDGTTRTKVRAASLAKFPISPGVADVDLTQGEYPDLLEQLAGWGTTAQPFIDEAWHQVVNELYRLGEWPDVIVSQSALREPVRQRTYYLIFKALYRRTPGDNRFEVLYKEHLENYKTAFAAMTYTVDRDQDGVPDSDARTGASGVVHRNAAPRRRLRRTARW